MRIATTTEEFNRFYSTHLEKIKALTELGFKYIDISFYAEHNPGSELLADNWSDTIQQIKAFGEQNNIKYVQAHCPGGNILSKDDKYDLTLKANLRALKACRILGIKNAVIHAGWAEGIGKQEFYAKNRDYIRLLLPTLEKYDINLCIENSCKANLGKFYYFFDGTEMREFIDYMNHPNIKACWDTGHANIEGHHYQDITALGDKLTALHINDNKGEKDEHMLPFMGTMNIDEVMVALKEIGFNGYFTFESGNAVIFNNGWPHKRREFSQSKKALNPSLECKKIFTRSELTIGKQILTAYDCYED